MPKQFCMPKHHANIEVTPGEAKSQSQKAARKGEMKWITPYESQAYRISIAHWEFPFGVHTKTSRGAQRVCVPAWRILRRKGGRVASMESFVRLVKAYIQEYPATAHIHCIKRPGIVISNIV
jgi:hypothetical protein